MVLLTAIKGHDYENKWRAAGDTYEAAEPVAGALVIAGICKYAAKQIEAPCPAPQPEPTVSAVAQEAKRKYKRRDMVPVK